MNRIKTAIICIGSVITLNAGWSSAPLAAQSTRPATRAATRPSTSPGTLPNVAATEPALMDRRDRIAEIVGRIVAQSHGVEAWRTKSAVQADLDLEFGANVMQGRMIYSIKTGRVRMELKDGTTLVFDGEKAWVSPAAAMFDAARFHLKTWPFFLTAPLKLQDPDVRLTAFFAPKLLRTKPCDSFKLTFKPGGDHSADDWCIVYSDPKSHLVAGLAYSMNGKMSETAATQPQAITYENDQTIDGVTLAGTWTFWRWTPDHGIEGDPIGKATLASIKFIAPAEDAFTKPADAREVQ